MRRMLPTLHHLCSPSRTVEQNRGVPVVGAEKAARPCQLRYHQMQARMTAESLLTRVQVLAVLLLVAVEARVPLAFWQISSQRHPVNTERKNKGMLLET